MENISQGQAYLNNRLCICFSLYVSHNIVEEQQSTLLRWTVKIKLVWFVWTVCYMTKKNPQPVPLEEKLLLWFMWLWYWVLFRVLVMSILLLMYSWSKNSSLLNKVILVNPAHRFGGSIYGVMKEKWDTNLLNLISYRETDSQLGDKFCGSCSLLWIHWLWSTYEKIWTFELVGPNSIVFIAREGFNTISFLK